jgi:hypothetical protein
MKQNLWIIQNSIIMTAYDIRIDAAKEKDLHPQCGTVSIILQ